MVGAAKHRFTLAPAFLQVGIVLGGFAALAFAPPIHGALLLVPTTAQGADRLAAFALGHGAQLLAQGPLPGSIVVLGDRAALARRGVLSLAAPRALCGDLAFERTRPS